MAPKRKRLSPQPTYKVFLSFRGPDTRQGFTNVLYHALVDAGIREVFLDDEEIRVGEHIGDEIRRAIQDSKIFVPIFSKGYASSKWCLIELFEMLKSVKTSASGKKIMPIFYNVTVDEVKLKKKRYVKALEKHKEDFGEDRVEPWEDALKEAGKIKGWELKDKGHADFAKSFAAKVSMKLKVKHELVTDYLVQRDDQVEALMKLLKIEDPKVRYVGIHGMGGIGKTTLAKIIYNKLCGEYKNCCSFLDDVREFSEQKRIVDLQKKLLEDVGVKFEQFLHAKDGIKKMRETLPSKKVLIVLDDVDDLDQVRSLAGDAFWFGKGSRIIITTRNQEILERTGVKITQEVEVMKPQESLQLFSKHAFAKDSPPIEYLSLSEEAVESTGRLPLSLEVIGAYLRTIRPAKWPKKIKRLKSVPHEDVQKKLMISYEALDHGTKQIFLDIACFFVGQERTYPMYMWEARDNDAKMRLKKLVNMSLMKIHVDIDEEISYMEVKTKWLQMHDQLRDLGREIVRLESSKNDLKCNRLWMFDEALEVLQEEEGKENVEMLRLECPLQSEDGYLIMGKKISELKKLRYLQCPAAHFIGNGRHSLPQLRWLNWLRCPFRFTITKLSLKNLVILQLTGSDIDENWSGWSQIEVGSKLKVLDLSYCWNFTKTPDLSKYPSLERLILLNCESLIEIDPSIGKLRDLKVLDVGGCYSLKGLPEELCSLEHLEIIGYHNDHIFGKDDDISKHEDQSDQGCSFESPESTDTPTSLTRHDLDDFQLNQLRESIGGLSELCHLKLSSCQVDRLPNWLFYINSLVELRLSFTKIVELPEEVGQLMKLKILDLSGCRNLKKLPDSIGELRSLHELDLSDSRIDELPDTVVNLKKLRNIMLSKTLIRKLPTSMGKLKRLELLDTSYCRLLSEIPSKIKGCTRLKTLDLSYNVGLKKLPDSIRSLRSLTELYILYSNIMELPDDIGNLKELREIKMENTLIQRLPTSIGMLKSLETLSARGCNFLSEIPSEIEGCSGLRVLDLRGTRVCQLPPKLPVGLTDLRKPTFIRVDLEDEDIWG